MTLDAIILAAGRASRLGLPKALLPAGPNHTLLSRVVMLALGAVDGTVFVVVGSEPEMMHVEIARCAALVGSWGRGRLKTIANMAYTQGQSTSLVAAVRQVRADGALVLLVDQPALQLDHVRCLVTTWRARRSHVVAVASALGGHQRTPVILDATLFPEILVLEGDEGARRVLRERPSQTQRVECAEGAWQIDVDGWDDYQRLARLLEWDREQGAADLSPTESQERAHRSVVQQWAVISARETEPARRLTALRHLVLAALQS